MTWYTIDFSQSKYFQRTKDIAQRAENNGLINSNVWSSLRK